jgi:hypothetical protein
MAIDGLLVYKCSSCFDCALPSQRLFRQLLCLVLAAGYLRQGSDNVMSLIEHRRLFLKTKGLSLI